MRKVLLLGAAMLLGGGLSAPALGQDFGSSASGSLSVTVIIPPLAPILAANAQGAVGLWSMSDPNGLMIRFGQQGDRDGKRSLTLYASPNNALAVRMADRSDTLNPSERTNVGGLTQTTFALSGSPRPAARDMTVIISGV